MRELPERVGQERIDLDGLAGDLDVRVVAKKRLGSNGRWHRYQPIPPTEPKLWEEEPDEVEVVQLKTDTGFTARRYAMAHELGHVVLSRESDRRSAELPVSNQEEFANAFAAELLLPPSIAERVKGAFRATTDVLGTLELAKSVGAPPLVLLVRAMRDNWLAGLDVVWLDVRTTVNEATGRDRRPRIVRCVCDRGRWYLPPNRSVSGVFGDDTWLASAGRGMKKAGRMDISRRRGSPPRFVHEAVPAEVLAFRMRQPEPPVGPEVLARVELRPGEGSDG